MIPYTRQPLVDKHFVKQHLSNWYVYKYDTVDNGVTTATKVKHCVDRDEALKFAFEQNDWIYIGPDDVYKPTSGNAFALAYLVKPWEHVLIRHNKIYIFVWDTREITKVAKLPKADVLPYLHKANDNRKALKLDGELLHESELAKLAVNYRTEREHRVGTECDAPAASDGGMSYANSDNSGTAPDVTSTSETTNKRKKPKHKEIAEVLDLLKIRDI